jgi:hypothetical protein
MNTNNKFRAIGVVAGLLGAIVLADTASAAQQHRQHADRAPLQYQYQYQAPVYPSQHGTPAYDNKAAESAGGW